MPDEPTEHSAAYPVARVVRKYPPPPPPPDYSHLMPEFDWCLDHDAPAVNVCYHKLGCRLEKRRAVPSHMIEKVRVEPGYTLSWTVKNMTTLYYWAIEEA